MDNLNILIVNWDFFINVPNQIRENMFPQSTKDLTLKEQRAAWITKYTDPALETIKANEEAVDYFRKRFIKAANGRNVKKVLVLDHYSKIAEVIDELYYSGQYGKFDNVEITHISQYHHMDSDNGVMSTLKDLTVNGGALTMWVANKNSEQTDIIIPGMTVKVGMNKEYLNKTFLAIMVIREDMSMPPHLDETFINMCSPFEECTCDYISQIGMKETRFNDKFLKDLRLYRETSMNKNENPEMRSALGFNPQ